LTHDGAPSLGLAAEILGVTCADRPGEGGGEDPDALVGRRVSR